MLPGFGLCFLCIALPSSVAVSFFLTVALPRSVGVSHFFFLAVAQLFGSITFLWHDFDLFYVLARSKLCTAQFSKGLCTKLAFVLCTTRSQKKSPTSLKAFRLFSCVHYWYYAILFGAIDCVKWGWHISGDGLWLIQTPAVCSHHSSWSALGRGDIKQQTMTHMQTYHNIISTSLPLSISAAIRPHYTYPLLIMGARPLIVDRLSVASNDTCRCV